MKETVYVFKLDSQNRILVPLMAQQIYGFEDDVYLKLQVIDGEKYLQISGREIQFFQSMSKLDEKGRFSVPKEVMEKLEFSPHQEFDSYEEEIDSNNRTLLLKKVYRRWRGFPSFFVLYKKIKDFIFEKMCGIIYLRRKIGGIAMEWNQMIPEFDVFDLKESLHFYIDLIGFHVEYDRKENKFAFLQLEKVQIMIQEIDKENNKWGTGKLEYPLGVGINFQIDVTNIDEIYGRLKEAKYQIFVEMEDHWYRKNDVLMGCREFLVQDPSGFVLRFSQDLENRPVEE